MLTCNDIRHVFETNKVHSQFCLACHMSCGVSQLPRTSQPHLELWQSRKETQRHCNAMWMETNQLVWCGCMGVNWNSLQRPTTGDNLCYSLWPAVTCTGACTLFVMCSWRLKTSGMLCDVSLCLQARAYYAGEDDWGRKPVVVVMQCTEWSLVGWYGEWWCRWLVGVRCVIVSYVLMGQVTDRQTCVCVCACACGQQCVIYQHCPMMRFCNKGKAVPAHDMKVYGGSRVIALFILNLGARCKRVIIFMAMLPPAPVKQPLTSIE